MSPHNPSHLIRYAAAHRDPRNIALHCWGVPLVVLGVACLWFEEARHTWALAASASGLLLQAVGHWYEGRRQRLGWSHWGIAPLFVALQWAHHWGWAVPLWNAVEQGAGPRRMRDLAL